MHRAGGDGVLNKSEQPFQLPSTDSCENDAATQQHCDEVMGGKQQPLYSES